MKKTSKKGFTMVELVIVIAVVAILAAVLIPTFISLSRKANQSVDTQLIVNLNRILATAEVSDGKNVTMYDALQDALEGGYDVTKISPTDASSDILWDQETDRFLAVTKDGEEYKVVASDGEYENFQPGHTFWKIYTKDIPESANQTYSIYWAGEGEPNVTEFSVGFDMGDFTGVEEENEKAKTVEAEVSYAEFTLNSGFADGVIVRIPLGALNVKGNNAGVHVYGVLSKLTYAPYADGVLTVHAYVAELAFENATFTAKLVSNGAKYHQEFAEIESLFNQNSKITHEVVLAEYLVHYFNEKNECLFCEEGHQGEITDPTDPTDPTEPSNPGGDTGNNPGNGNNGNNPGTTCKHTNTTVTIKEANCTEAGLKTITCSDCNQVIKQEAIPALGHDYASVLQSAVQPTCTTEGHSAQYECSRCHCKSTPEFYPANGHKVGEDGKCTVCGEFVVQEMNQDNYKQIKKADKMNGLIYVKLTSDVTMTRDEFGDIFATKYSYKEATYDENNNKVEKTVTLVPVIYIADIDFNGFTLTIQSNGPEENSDDWIFIDVLLNLHGSTGTLKMDELKPAFNGVVYEHESQFLFNMNIARVQVDNITVDVGGPLVGILWGYGSKKNVLISGSAQIIGGYAWVVSE